jgi:hypothetical protein
MNLPERLAFLAERLEAIAEGIGGQGFALCALAPMSAART